MSFLNPLLLIGALGVALPILAHLINRQQVQRTDWAAMRFLDRNVRVRSRQVRLRDLLLLLMRCFALLLIVFALARPATGTDSGLWLPGERSAGVVIAIDGSFSMSHREDSQSRFERAMEQVQVISESIRPGDPVSLVRLGQEHDVLLRNVAFDRDRFSATLAELEPTPQAMDLDSVPQTLQALVDDMDAQRKEVYLVTDTQARQWGRATDALNQGLLGLSERADVFLVPIPGGAQNLAVTDLALLAGPLRNGAVARYRATVQNFGEEPVADVEVRCRVDGVQIDSKRIPLIAPGTAETVSLFVPFYNAGTAQITAEITDASLETDNVRRVVAVVREKVSVLCLDGSNGDASRLITAGLLARADGQADEGYAVRTVRWPSFPPEGVDAFDVVILADVPEITQQQAKDLSRFVREGKGLVWFAGPNVKAAAWNELAESSETSLLPATLSNAVDVRDALGVGKPLATDLPDHAITRPLTSLPEDLLSETRFLQRQDVEPIDTSFPVLTLAGSSAPVLLEQSLGRGHVFMFTTSAGTTWNNMALTPVFPMLMQQVVTHLTGRSFEPSRVVGDALTLSFAEQPDANDAVFETPGEETITVPVTSQRGRFVALLERSAEAGFYTAKVSVQSPGVPVAVNVDTNESRVAGLDRAALVEQLNGTGVEIVADEAELASAIQATRTGRSSWRFFMLAALCLLVAESLFADRLRARKTQRSATSLAEAA
jgi:hypothetical protein